MPLYRPLSARKQSLKRADERCYERQRTPLADIQLLSKVVVKEASRGGTALLRIGCAVLPYGRGEESDLSISRTPCSFLEEISWLY